MKKIILVIFIFPFILSAQNKDSLKLALMNAKHDTTRCKILSVLIESEEDDNIWPKYNDQLGLIAKENIARSEVNKNFYLKQLAFALNNIGYLANSQGDIPRSLDYFRKSLFIQEKINDKRGVAESLNNIGAIYKKQGSIKKALEFYQKGLNINKEIGNKEGEGTALNNIAGIYDTRGEISKALVYYNLSLKIAEELGDKSSTALCYNNIGYIYNRMGDVSKSLFYMKGSLKIQEEIRDNEGIVNSLSNIAFLLAENGRPNEGLKYANRSLQISKELDLPESIKNSAQALKKVFQKQNKYEEAMEMYALEIKMSDSINNDATQKAAIKNQMRYEFEKKELVAKAEYKLELEKQQAVSEEKQRRQKLIIGSVVAGLILVILFIGYAFKILKVTRRQKLIIEIKNREVEEKQMEILDSIHYAKRIQRALIPSDRYIHKSLMKLQKSTS